MNIPSMEIDDQVFGIVQWMLNARELKLMCIYVVQFNKNDGYIPIRK